MKKCLIEDCDSKIRAKGYCSKHYDRVRKYGDPNKLLMESRNGSCKKDNCTKIIYYKGLCRKHYEMDIKNPKAEVCSVSGCNRKKDTSQYCDKHYRRMKKHGTINKVLKPMFGTITKRGYRLITKHNHPNANKHGKILEHRYVMSIKLGRPLLSNENVHHINGDKLDNRPENLELWIKSQPCGQRPEDLVNWALDILKLYNKMAG